jgi:hypothetical protein
MEIRKTSQNLQKSLRRIDKMLSSFAKSIIEEIGLTMGISSGLLLDKYWRTSEFKEENEPCRYKFMKLRQMIFYHFDEKEKKYYKQ